MHIPTHPLDSPFPPTFCLTNPSQDVYKRQVKEIPFSFGTRYRGDSKANFKVAWDYGLLLMRLYAARFLGRG